MRKRTHVCPKHAELEIQLLNLLLECDRQRLNQRLEICHGCGRCDRLAREVLGDFFHALITEGTPARSTA